MKTTIYFAILAILASIFFGCSEPKNENAVQSQPEKKRATQKKMIFIQRNGKSISVPEDSLNATFKVVDKIDSVLILLSDSVTKRGKNFQNILAAFEKRETEKEVIYLLYPEFRTQYGAHPEEDAISRTRMTIHLLKQDMEQRDTLFYSWVEGDERKTSKKPEKRFLRKGYIFTEIETPVWCNNVYHQAKTPKAMVKWIINVLCNDYPFDELTGDAEQFYAPEKQYNAAKAVSFRGISWEE